MYQLNNLIIILQYLWMNDKVCHSKEQLECHHIKEQQEADEHNMIDNRHKNKKHNLVCLCKTTS